MKRFVFCLVLGGVMVLGGIIAYHGAARPGITPHHLHGWISRDTGLAISCTGLFIFGLTALSEILPIFLRRTYI